MVISYSGRFEHPPSRKLGDFIEDIRKFEWINLSFFSKEQEKCNSYRNNTDF